MIKSASKVNATTDRRTAHAAIAVFNNLYHHKRFKSWHIDNVFELVDKETPPFRYSAGSEQIDTEAFKSFDAPMHSLGHGVISNAREEN